MIDKRKINQHDQQDQELVTRTTRRRSTINTHKEDQQSTPTPSCSKISRSGREVAATITRSGCASNQQGISIFKPKQEEANGLEAGSRNQTSLKSIGTMKALLL